jgi:hypothetical protein
LADVHAQGRAVPLGDARNFGEPPEIRPHHHRDDRDGYAEPAAPFRLRVHQIPVARAALRVLFFTRRVVEREFQIVERAKLVVAQKRDAQAVRRHRQLDVPAAQKCEHLAKLRMHAVLARAEIYRLDRQPVEHRSDLVDVETIDSRGVAITERARKVALVRQTQPEREPRRRAAVGGCTGYGLGHRHPRQQLTSHPPRCSTPPA